MGFPPGVAEKMVLRIIVSFRPPFICFVCSQLLDSFKKYPFRGLPPAEGAPPSPTTRVSRPHRGPKDTDSRPVKKIDEISSPDSTEANAATASALSVSEHSKLSTMQLNPDNGKQIPIGNGGYSENYYWTQTLGEVTVYVDVPTGTRGKQVDCVMKPRFLSLAVGGAGQGHGGSDEPLRLLGGDLEDVVRLDESLWTVASDDSSTQAWRVIWLYMLCLIAVPHELAGDNHSRQAAQDVVEARAARRPGDRHHQGKGVCTGVGAAVCAVAL